MPEIIQNTEQVQALADVTNALADVKMLNRLLLNANEETPYFVSRGKKQGIAIDSTYSKRIVAILKAQRDHQIRNILYKTERFQLMLSDDEKALIGEIGDAKDMQEHKARSQKAKTSDEVSVSESALEDESAMADEDNKNLSIFDDN